MENHKIFKMSFSRIYDLYIKKVERKGRSQAEVDQVITWLTGYTLKQLAEEVRNEVTLEDFILKSPQLNPSRRLIKGLICGVRVEDIKNSVMQTIRYMDKLVDEVAKGRSMEKILRK